MPYSGILFCNRKIISTKRKQWKILEAYSVDLLVQSLIEIPYHHVGHIGGDVNGWQGRSD